MQCGRVAPWIAVQQPSRAGVVTQQAEQDPDGGGLAGPVGAEESVHLTGLDRQVQPVECARPAEGLDQAGHGDHR
jgi:hypothetical protein